jgi:hypothetical protein
MGEVLDFIYRLIASYPPILYKDDAETTLKIFTHDDSHAGSSAGPLDHASGAAGSGVVMPGTPLATSGSRATDLNRDQLVCVTLHILAYMENHIRWLGEQCPESSVLNALQGDISCIMMSQMTMWPLEGNQMVVLIPIIFGYGCYANKMIIARFMMDPLYLTSFVVRNITAINGCYAVDPRNQLLVVRSERTFVITETTDKYTVNFDTKYDLFVHYLSFIGKIGKLFQYMGTKLLWIPDGIFQWAKMFQLSPRSEEVQQAQNEWVNIWRQSFLETREGRPWIAVQAPLSLEYEGLYATYCRKEGFAPAQPVSISTPVGYDAYQPSQTGETEEEEDDLFDGPIEDDEVDPNVDDEVDPEVDPNVDDEVDPNVDDEVDPEVDPNKLAPFAKYTTDGPVTPFGYYGYPPQTIDGASPSNSSVASFGACGSPSTPFGYYGH